MTVATASKIRQPRLQNQMIAHVLQTSQENALETLRKVVSPPPYRLYSSEVAPSSYLLFRYVQSTISGERSVLMQTSEIDE